MTPSDVVTSLTFLLTLQGVPWLLLLSCHVGSKEKKEFILIFTEMALVSMYVDHASSIKIVFPISLSLLQAIVVEAIRTGELRGYVSQPDFYLPPTAPIGYALRAGSLTSYKTLYDHAKPMQSTTPLAACDIASDVELHYQLSDQIPTIIDLDTVLSPSGDGAASKSRSIEVLQTFS
jgi:redox-regulated HSP33 family molecular chaperone